MGKLTSEELIIETFKELSKEKSVSKITIREILERSGLSKPTFYKYFSDKNELIYRICSLEARKSLQCAELVAKGYEESVVIFYERALEMDYYLQSFKYDVELQVLLYESIYDIGMEYFINKISKSHTEMTLESKVSLTYFCAGSSHIFIEWIRNNMKETPQAIAAAVMKAIPAPLFELVDLEEVF